MNEKNSPKRIALTKENINFWPKFQRLLDDGKAVFDKKGRLRYKHGAPVGDMVFVRFDKTGAPIYQESAQEWFDPDSQKAKDFKWPE